MRTDRPCIADLVTETMRIGGVTSCRAPDAAAMGSAMKSPRSATPTISLRVAGRDGERIQSETPSASSRDKNWTATTEVSGPETMLASSPGSGTTTNLKPFASTMAVRPLHPRRGSRVRQPRRCHALLNAVPSVREEDCNDTRRRDVQAHGVSSPQVGGDLTSRADSVLRVHDPAPMALLQPFACSRFLS